MTPQVPDSSRGQVSRRQRVRLLGWAALVAIFLVVVLAAVPFFIDLNRYRDRWLPVFESAVGRRVEVGTIQLTLMTGLGARIDGLVIHDVPSAGLEPMLRVDSVLVRVRFLPLLRGRLEVGRVTLIRPQLRLVRDPAEVMNVLAEASGTAPASPASGVPASRTAVAALSLADLVIDEGSIIYEDRSVVGTPTRYVFDHLQASLQNLAIGQTLAVDATTRFEGGDLTLSLKGTAGPLDDTLWPDAIDLRISAGDSQLAVTGKREGGSLAVSARSERLDLAQIRAILKRAVPTIPEALSLAGPGALAITFRPEGDRFAVDGRIDLDAGRVAYGIWFLKPEHVPFSAAFTGTMSRSRSPVEPLRVALSAVDLRLHTVEARGTAGVVVGDHISTSGTLTTGDTDLGGWERLVPALTSGRIAGRASLDVSWALDPPAVPAYTATVRVADASAALPGLTRPIERVTGAITLAQDRVTIPRLAMRVGESDLTVRGALAGLASPTGAFTVSSSRLDLAEVMPPQTPPVPPAGSNAGPVPSAGPGRSTAPETMHASAIVLPPSLRAASLRFTLNVKRVMGPSWPELRDVSGSVLFERGTLVLKGVKAGVYGGTVLLAGRLDPFAATRTFDLDARADKLDTAEVLTQWTSLKDFLTGRLDGRLALRGSGSTWTAFAPTLAGKGEVAITDGAFRTFNVVQDVLKAASALGMNQVAERPDTPFQHLAAAIEIRDGVIHLEDVGLSAGDYGATASGVIGLDTSVNVRAQVRVPQRSAGGWAKTAIGSAFIGSDGQLSIPILLSGRLPRPEVALDRSAFVGEAGQRLRERAKDALREFLDQPQQDGKTPRDLLKELLKR